MVFMGQYGDPIEQKPTSLDDMISEFSLFSLLADHVIKGKDRDINYMVK